MAHRIGFFETNSGRIPVAEYIKEASKRDQAEIIHIIELLEEEGFELLGTKFLAKLTKDLYELRIKGEQLHRILLFYWTGTGFIILHAFTKQSNKTPLDDLKTAEKRMALWIGRNKEDRKGKTN